MLSFVGCCTLSQIRFHSALQTRFVFWGPNEFVLTLAYKLLQIELLLPDCPAFVDVNPGPPWSS